MTEQVSVQLELIDHLTKELGAVNAQIKKHFDSMEKGAQKVSKATGDMKAPITAAQAAFATLGAVAGGVLVRSFIQAGTEFENLTVQFKVLLGSADEAKKRIKEYSEFGAKTPFELGEIARAGRVLQTFGGTILATGDNLKLVGDIAAGTQTPFENTAMWIGRMYDALQSGRPWGEAGMRLQEMGALSGVARAKLEGMQAAGKSSTEIWGQFREEMGRFNGMMDEMSATVSGKWSTTMDLMRTGMREILAGGGWDKLNGLLSDTNVTLQKLIDSGALKRFGENLGMITVAARDLGIVWAGIKIAGALESFRLAAIAAATGAKGFSAALGPIAIAATAVGVALDLIIQKQSQIADKKADLGWFSDPDKIAQVRAALADWKSEHARTMQQLKEGRRTFDTKDQEASDKLKAITGFTGGEVERLWSEHVLALKEGWLRRDAIVKAAKAGATPSGGGNSPDNQEAVDKANKEASAILDAMESGRNRSLAAAQKAQETMTQVEQEGEATRELSRAATRERQLEAEKQFSDSLSQYAMQSRALDGSIMQSKFALADAVAGAIGQMTGAQMAAMVVQRAIAGGLIIANSLAAAAAALAPPPIGLGPLLGLGLAAKIKTGMFLNLGALAASTAGSAIGKFAKGTDFAPGGSALVGELGPEIVNLPRGSQVIPHRPTANILNGAKSAPISNTISADFSVTISGNATPETVRQLDDLSKDHVDRVAKAVAMAMDNRNPELLGAFRQMGSI